MNRGSRTLHRRRRLAPARFMTGKERRRINPNKGLVKIIERNLDVLRENHSVILRAIPFQIAGLFGLGVERDARFAQAAALGK